LTVSQGSSVTVCCDRVTLVHRFAGVALLLGRATALPRFASMALGCWRGPAPQRCAAWLTSRSTCLPFARLSGSPPFRSAGTPVCPCSAVALRRFNGFSAVKAAGPVGQGAWVGDLSAPALASRPPIHRGRETREPVKRDATSPV
jgi:hypothetical protein